MEEMLATLTGLALPVLAQYQRFDDEQSRKIRNNRLDVRDLQAAFSALNTNGQAIRNRLPIVNDWNVGIALSTQIQPSPSPIPSVPVPLTRPNLCQGIENFVATLQWPPRPGQYDAVQNVIGVGELTTTALALTFEEVRAALHAFILCGGSNGTQRIEIYRALNALVEVAASSTLTKADFLGIWQKLFLGTEDSNPHRDPTKPPKILAVNTPAHVKSVNFHAGGPTNEDSPQTDSAHRLVIEADPALQVLGDTPLCTIQFGTDYLYLRNGVLAALVPCVQVSNPLGASFRVIPSKSSYQLFNMDPIAPGSKIEVYATVEAGVKTA